MRTLSKRHYEDLAAAIKAANDAEAKRNASRVAINGRPYPLPWTLRDANTLAGFLASDSPRFQPYRFVAACGFGTWKATRRKRDRATGLLVDPAPSGSWQSGG